MRVIDYDEYDEYEDYEVGGLRKTHKKNNKEGRRAGKGHQSRHQSKERWDEMEVIDMAFYPPELPEEEITPIVSTPIIESKPITVNADITPSTNGAVNNTTTGQFNAGPNTHTIKGNIIDFDRVANVEKIENEHLGKMTYGIKFLFVGKKGLFRVAWFNKNIAERDKVFEQEYNFWKSLSTK